MSERRRPTQPLRSGSDESPSESTSTSRSENSNSSKASPPPADGSASQIDFQFLNFSHPSEAKASRARRTVRSHVTRQQHQKEHAAAAARRAQSLNVLPPSSEQQHEQASTQQTAPVYPTASVGTTLAIRSAPITSAVPTPGSATSNIVYSTHIRASSSSSPASSNGAEGSSAAPSPSPSSAHASSRVVDMSELYPASWHPYIRRILEHYLSSLAMDMPDLGSPQARALFRARYFALLMTDPASCHALLLLATSHYNNVHGIRSNTVSVLDLRGMAIRAINSALEDPTRATSDQVIAAVAQMAAYEVVYGDRSIFHTHMTGLLRMVSLRGGLPAIGLEGLLERVLLWIDANAAFIARSHVYFDRAAFPSRTQHPRPDPVRFAGIPTQKS